jgi:hypothetical protein
MEKEVVDQLAEPRVWKAPELTVLGKLRSVTESGGTQFGDAVPNQGTLPGDSGSTS